MNKSDFALTAMYLLISTDEPSIDTYLQRLIDSKLVSFEDLLMNIARKGNWIYYASANGFNWFLNQVLENHDPSIVFYTAKLLAWRLDRKPEELNALSPYALRLIKLCITNAPDSISTNFYDVVSLLQKYSVTYPVEVVECALEIGEYRDAVIPIIETAISVNPESVWSKIGDMLLSKDYNFHLLSTLEKIQLSKVFPSQVLMSWLEKTEPQGAIKLAQVLNLENDTLDAFTREFIIKFGQVNDVKLRLFSRFAGYGTVYSGSFVDVLRPQHDRAAHWMTDEDPVIRQWALELVAWIDRRIDENQD